MCVSDVKFVPHSAVLPSYSIKNTELLENYFTVDINVNLKIEWLALLFLHGLDTPRVPHIKLFRLYYFLNF